jgi:hypothetical protein
MQLQMMHPGELKSYALAAAAKADREGFTATAEAMMFLAQVCAGEARELEAQTAKGTWQAAR